MKYVAFLRGINVGGNSTVSMAKLKTVFEELGFTDVKTLLNSGNVIFSSDSKINQEKIEEKLEKIFGFHITLILRSETQIKKLIKSDPFTKTNITPNIRLNVSFVSDPEKEICSVIDITNKKTPELMKEVEKQYGKKVTTRTWNTVLKIGKLLES
jgi:uncharacterized protein (DUF1697 family)